MLRRSIATVALATAFLFAGGAGVQASIPTSGSGTFLLVATFGAPTTAGGNTFIPFTFKETITGIFTGVRIGTGTFVLHPDGTLDAHDSGVFTGTVAGSAPGTAILSVEASGTLAAISAQGQASDGTGGLVGIHGQAFVTGSAVSANAFGGAYTARAQFGAP